MLLLERIAHTWARQPTTGGRWSAHQGWSCDLVTGALWSGRRFTDIQPGKPAPFACLRRFNKTCGTQLPCVRVTAGRQKNDAEPAAHCHHPTHESAGRISLVEYHVKKFPKLGCAWFRKLRWLLQVGIIQLQLWLRVRVRVRARVSMRVYLPSHE